MEFKLSVGSKVINANGTPVIQLTENAMVNMTICNTGTQTTKVNIAFEILGNTSKGHWVKNVELKNGNPKEIIHTLLPRGTKIWVYQTTAASTLDVYVST